MSFIEKAKNVVSKIKAAANTPEGQVVISAGLYGIAIGCAVGSALTRSQDARALGITTAELAQKAMNK